MNRAIVVLVISVVFIFNFIQTVQADEISELKAQIQAMELRHQKEMTELKVRIETLETERKVRIETPEEMDERVQALEEKTKNPWEGGLLSLKGEKWELGGELEFEFVDTQTHASVDEPEPHFQLDKFQLNPKISFTDDIYLKGEIEFYRTSLEVKQVFAQFDNLPLNSFAKAGIVTRFMVPDRKTERYPLAGNVFWRDSEAGIITGGAFGPLYWRTSITSGLEMDQRSITEDNSLLMLHDNRKASNYTDPGELGGGLGIKYDFGKFGKFDTLGFGYISKMSASDESFLINNIVSYNSDARRQYRYGANVNYSLWDATVITHFIKASDGDLDRFAWYIQPSYKMDFAKIFKKPDWKFFYAVEPVFRYGALYLNVEETLGNSLTWDREEYTFALFIDIYKNIKLKNEFTIDRMDKGAGGRKDYGEFVSQLEIKF